jgi:hypothetical protein
MKGDVEAGTEEEQERVLMAGPSLGEVATSSASAALSSVKQAVVAGPESESRRWRRAFESKAKEVNGEL